MPTYSSLIGGFGCSMWFFFFLLCACVWARASPLNYSKTSIPLHRLGKIKNPSHNNILRTRLDANKLKLLCIYGFKSPRPIVKAYKHAKANLCWLLECEVPVCSVCVCVCVHAQVCMCVWGRELNLILKCTVFPHLLLVCGKSIISTAFACTFVHFHQCIWNHTGSKSLNSKYILNTSSKFCLFCFLTIACVIRRLVAPETRLCW